MDAHRRDRAGSAQVELLAYVPCLLLVLALVFAAVRIGLTYLRAEPSPASPATPQVGEPARVSLPEGEREAIRAIARIAG